MNFHLESTRFFLYLLKMFTIRMKNFIRLFISLILIIISAAANSQSSKELREIFAQAESHYLYEEYELANPLYLSLLSFMPDNCNIMYKIGNCYLNIPDEKEKAIEYLEKAVKNTAHNAKTELLKEKRAPLDAYFSLGKAYMVNNKIEEAINTFKIFQKLVKESPLKGEMMNIEFVDQQIIACQNALKMMETPVEFDKTKLPEDFSQGSINDYAVVSFDGSTIAYTERRGLANAIFYSKKERGRWQPPIEITYEINAGEDCSTCALNYDGTELFLYKDDMKDGNIYSTTYKDGKWSPIKRLNRNINTKFFESHACISPDGKKLYFTSNREDGNDLDIYVSEKDATGDWGVPKKLPETINSPYNEDTPFITISDTIIYFASEGHSSIGGYDIFRSIRRGDKWTEPENIGYPINTPDDNRFFVPFNNGLNAYYSFSTDYKKREIFYLGFGVPAIDHMFIISGNVMPEDTVQISDTLFKISLLDLRSGDTLTSINPENISGAFSITSNPGHFRLIFSGNEYITQTIDTLLDKNTPSDLITLNVTLKRKPVPIAYEKMDLSKVPTTKSIDSAILVKGVKVFDLEDKNVKESEVLYYTVQIMALRRPVDVKYFKNAGTVKVMYNDVDRFYRYTTGQFKTREEAIAWRAELIRRGYPEEIFVKKITK